MYDKINLSSFNDSVNANIISTIPIKTITIDDFVYKYKEFPTVLRMDVEGYEFNIIKGSIKTLKSADRLKIFMEIHPRILSDKILDLLNILKDNINECPPYCYSYIDKLNNFNHIKYGHINYEDFEDLIRNSQFMNGIEIFFEKSS